MSVRANHQGKVEGLNIPGLKLNVWVYSDPLQSQCMPICGIRVSPTEKVSSPHCFANREGAFHMRNGERRGMAEGADSPAKAPSKMFAIAFKTLRARTLLSLGVIAALAQSATAQAPQAQVRQSESTGTDVFMEKCATCHGNALVTNAPQSTILKQMTPEHIYDVLTNGVMKPMAAGLSDAQLRAVSEYLGGRKIDTAEVGAAKSMPNTCLENAGVRSIDGPSWNGWSVDNANTRSQSLAGASLSAGQVARLKLKWAFGFPNATALYGQTVVDGKVFVSSNAGYVYSLDARKGCVHWSFKPTSAVRSGIVIAPLKASSTRYAAFFGDIHGNVYAIDASTGEQIWKINVDPHPFVRITTAPKVYEGRVYVPVTSLEEGEASNPVGVCCTFRGMVVALDSESGRQIWKTYTIAEKPKFLGKNSAGKDLMGPSGAGVWTSPALDPKRRALYIGTGNQFSEPPVDTTDAVMAFNMDTGKVLWTFQETHADIWHGGCVQRIPETGPISGQRTVMMPPPSLQGAAQADAAPPRSNPNYPPENCPTLTGPDWDFGAALTLATLPDGRDILIAAEKQGMIYAFDPDKKSSLLWKNPVARWIQGGLGDTMFGAAVDTQHLYWGLQSGGIISVDLATGVEQWWAAWGSAPEMYRHPGVSGAVALIPGIIFAGGMDGRMRAVASFDGRALWEFDTNKEFQTVNGVTAHGGTIGAAGPVVVDGMVFVGSGYPGFQGGMPGNVLLAFAP
ncbi:MAG: PQQ-binding-like beta-propeller repeat protein [Bryobacteraceae bacterium]